MSGPASSRGREDPYTDTYKENDVEYDEKNLHTAGTAHVDKQTAVCGLTPNDSRICYAILAQYEKSWCYF